ncbi:MULTISPECIES: hypothetical protein [Mumia]|uniref:hypothetical protein n=1 Tax=Mumia TaxID=1546255 RepID=UPI00141FF151|nr:MULTISPECIES: hypothetical protein [unclassified Mumia]QMW65703.1 hypothetical protein H4N58_16230 [Mumia sp. ZJ1417]
MADRIAVDTDVLNEAGRGLRRTYEGFEQTNAWSRPDRETIAHNSLRDRLEEFADNWDDKREDMMEAIKGLGEAAEAAAEAFENLEDEFVKALEGK